MLMKFRPGLTKTWRAMVREQAYFFVIVAKNSVRPTESAHALPYPRITFKRKILKIKLT